MLSKRNSLVIVNTADITQGYFDNICIVHIEIDRLLIVFNMMSTQQEMHINMSKTCRNHHTFKMASQRTANQESILWAKSSQSAGLGIIEPESHVLYPGLNVVHTSNDAKKVLAIEFNYYVELKLKSSAFM